MKKFYERYKHAIPLIVYAFIYLSWFSYLERTVQNPQTIIHMKWDDMIPFCEVFVIPYYLWFGYVSIVVLYLLFKNKQDYYRACTFLFTGMTIFLLVSTLWPNGHHLRPAVMPRDNIFTTMVAALYKADTPTNLWPSIHVYNSIGAHLAVTHNEKLRKNKVIYFGHGRQPDASGCARYRLLLYSVFCKICSRCLIQISKSKRVSAEDKILLQILFFIMYCYLSASIGK